jgi:hypothetical protein
MTSAENLPVQGVCHIKHFIPAGHSQNDSSGSMVVSFGQMPDGGMTKYSLGFSQMKGAVFLLG